MTRFINALGEHHNLLELDIEGNVISCDGFFGIVKAVAASPTQNSLSKSWRYSPIFDRRRMHSSFYLCFGRINKTNQIPGFRRMRCICKWLDCLILRSTQCYLFAEKLSLRGTLLDDEGLLPLETRGQWNRMPQVPANIDRVLKLNASNEDKVGLARQ